MRQSIEIFQGDADTLTETIENLDSLEGYSAKLYIVTKAGVEVDTIDGVIDGLTIEYDLVNDSTKAYPVGVHDWESKIFDESDHVYTTSHGKFIVNEPINNEPDAEEE